MHSQEVCSSTRCSLLGTPDDVSGNTTGEVDKMLDHKRPCAHTEMNTMARQ